MARQPTERTAPSSSLPTASPPASLLPIIQRGNASNAANMLHPLSARSSVTSGSGRVPRAVQTGLPDGPFLRCLSCWSSSSTRVSLASIAASLPPSSASPLPSPCVPVAAGGVAAGASAGASAGVTAGVPAGGGVGSQTYVTAAARRPITHPRIPGARAGNSGATSRQRMCADPKELLP